MEKLLKTAIIAALEAGRKAMEIYISDDFDVQQKADTSPITKADLAAHEIIYEKLLATAIPILSEEGKNIPFETRKNWNKLWIVDPIDGTKEFVQKNGDFTVNIALVENQIPILGVIFTPVTGELFFATNAIGSFKFTVDEIDIGIEEILKNAQKLPMVQKRDSYIFVASKSHMNQETKNYIDEKSKKLQKFNLISRGSSLKLCMIAEGKADCYPRFGPTMEWDTAAGHAICLCAGFDLQDVETNESMKYNKENLLNNWFIAK